MNSEPKAFASLSSGLLARKGAARPAMRPQGFGQGSGGLDDLGWNDMGFEAPKPVIAPVLDADHDAFGEELSAPSLRNPLAALTPVASPVHDQQAEIADRFAAYDQDGEDEDEIDDTAEIYDPASDGAAPLCASLAPSLPVEAPAALEDVQPTEEPAPVAQIPAIKPSRTVEAPVATPVRVAAPRRTPRTRAAAGAKAKAAFTLRLDAERHLKLRLACAVDGRSAQHFVTEALDRFLAEMPELNAMAARASKKPSH
jgi:hypothetical protein